MKSILFVLAFIFGQMAHAIGNEGVGGGDLCEARFKTVAGDLQTWLKAGGAQGLVLKNPQGEISQAAYTGGMLSQIANFHVTCVSPGDPGYPVIVAGQAKECRSMRDSAGVGQVVCDRAKFYSDLQDPENDPTQYKLVHHEFATLAGFEVPNQGDSQYWISEQITGFLENQSIKKLVVKPAAGDKPRIGSITLPHQDMIGIAVSPDRKRLAYSDGVHLVKVLDLVSYASVVTQYQAPAPTGQPPRMQFSPEGSLLLVGDSFIINQQMDYTVVDSRTGAKKYQVAKQYFAEFTPDGKSLVTVDAKATVAIRKAADGKLLKTYALPQMLKYGDIEGWGTISADNTKLIIGSAQASDDPNGKMSFHLVDLNAGHIVLTVSGPYGQSPGFAFSPDAKQALFSFKDSYALYDTASGKKIKSLDDGFQTPEGIRWLADGRILAKQFNSGCIADVSSESSQERFIGLACSREAAIDTDASGSVLIGQVGETDIVASSLKTGRLLGLVWSQDLQLMSYYQGLSVLSADRALVVTQGPTATPARGSNPLDLTIRILEIPQEP